MPRSTFAFTNFTAGELSPRLDGRTDLQKYFQGCKTLQNMVVHPHGGATRRPGTKFIAETKSNGEARLIPFEFSTTQTYVLEFGNTYMRVYKDGGQVLNSGTVVEISTPYSAAEANELKFTQSADVLYIVHPSHQPRKLSRSSHTSWSLSLYAPTNNPFGSSNNFPSCVTFFEERLVFAGTNNDPQKLFFSKAGDFEDMTTGTNAGDGMSFTIGSDQVNAIKYLKGLRTLLIGTVGGEFVATASTSAEPITPTNIQIKRQAGYGTSDVDALLAGNRILFVQRAGKKVRELVFDFDTDGYIAPDLTLLAEHIAGSGVGTGFTNWTYQQEPDSIVWVVRSDGVLTGMTYQRGENVVAWHRHILGGAFSSGNAVVESVAAISNSLASSKGEDSLYMIVKRTINGGTKRYVEVMQPFDFADNIEDAWFLDSALQYSGSATTSLSGLDHLEGQTVSILANGSTHPDKVVSSGAITLDRSVTKATVGLKYTSALQTMRIESGSADGSAQGKVKRIQEITTRFFQTVGAELGSSSTSTDLIPFRDSSMAMDTAVELFTGDKQIEFNADYETDGFIYIQQQQPLPMTITAMYPQLNTYDG
jgi:hypothetical protein